MTRHVKPGPSIRCRLGTSVLVICALAAFNALPACAQDQNTSAGEPAAADKQPAPFVRPPYALVTSDEDWSFLSTVPRSDFFDRIKYVRLKNGSDDWFLSVGGEVREVYERISNDNWGLTPPRVNGYLTERYMLHTDWHLGSHFRAFFELKSGLETGRAGGPRPIDEDRLDLLQGFFDLSFGEPKHRSVTLRVGRQELNYGSGRLVSVREGPNVRQSFDGVKLIVEADAWRVDLFAARPDTDTQGYFGDAPLHSTSFWGIYGTRPLSARSRLNLDLYYLGLDRKRAVFEAGAAREQRQTLGGRLWRPAAVNESGVDFDYEALYQLGSFGTGDIRAWTAASETGYTFSTLPLHPRLSLRGDISSGDRNPNDHDLQTFNALFPVGNYFGVIATTGPGPVNFRDLHPMLQLQLLKNVTVAPDWVFYWRQSLNDGVYAVPGFLIVSSNGSKARFVGQRPGVEARWQVDRHTTLQLDYGKFYAGEFLREASPGRDLGYFAAWFIYKF